MKCPCIECPKAGCGAFHDECEQYQEYSKRRQLAATRRQQDKDVKDAIIKGRLRVTRKKVRGKV